MQTTVRQLGEQQLDLVHQVQSCQGRLVAERNVCKTSDSALDLRLQVVERQVCETKIFMQQIWSAFHNTYDASFKQKSPSVPLSICADPPIQSDKPSKPPKPQACS